MMRSSQLRGLACLSTFLVYILLCPLWDSDLQQTEANTAVVTYIENRDLEVNNYDILIVGAGLSGTVFADLYARHRGKRVLVVEKRAHIAGNCFDYKDPDTGILRNKYGMHVFHTSNKLVWQYVQRFSKWLPYDHRLIGSIDGQLVPLPVTIETVNRVFGLHITSVEEMDKLLEVHGEASLWQQLIEKFGANKWDIFPHTSSIPVRSSWDDRYFPSDSHQGVPQEGYTKWFEKALSHNNIHVLLNTDVFDLIHLGLISKDFEEFSQVIFTGKIDSLVSERKKNNIPPLKHTSVRFVDTTVETDTTYQSSFVINGDPSHDATPSRVVEYKHLFNQLSDKSLLVKEYTTDVGGEPFFPVIDEENDKALKSYKHLASEDNVLATKVHFQGHLALFEYQDMDSAIMTSIDHFASMEGASAINFLSLVETPEWDSILRLHFVISIFNEDPSWISRLCETVREQVHAEIRFFVYTKNPLDDVRRLQEQIDYHLTGCQTPVERNRNHFQKLPNVGREGHTWLTHMLSNSFSLGDINVFLQGSKEASVDVILKTIRTAKRHLFDRQASRASQPATFNHDIYDVMPYPNQPTLDEFLSMEIVEESPIQHEMHFQILNLFHPNINTSYQKFVTETKERLDAIKHDFCELYNVIFSREHKAGTTCETAAVSYRGEFTVTEAAIRRMLAKYRNDMLLLQKQLESENDPLIGHSLERCWLRLFRYR